MNLLFSTKLSFQKIFFSFITIFICLHLSAQRLDTLLMMYNQKYPQERIHLQFDKSSYAPQDTVWFKAYLLTGISLDTMSKSLYVDFSDEKGKVWAHDVFPIAIMGTTFGQFRVPDSIPGNLIHVRAYTKWMLNFDSSFLYNKNLTLLQPKAKRYKGTPPASQPTLYFFPEGGDLVARLKSRVAFMCEDQYAQPCNISGSVKDGAGNEVAKLNVQHDGMGSFYFIPDNNQKYTATWTDDQGNTHTTNLPDVKSNGVSLSVIPQKNQSVFEIQRQDNAADNLKNLHIVATLYQQVVYMANISLNDKPTVSGVIPVSEFPSGIMQVTVLDNAWMPLAERIVCLKNNDDIFQPELGFSKLSFNTRGQNELAINVPDSIPASFSVAVTDAVLSADSSNNILSDMFIASQIKGHIYKPYYYLDTTDKVNKDLDLVMLTHGWRRFDWQDVTKQRPLAIKYPMDTTYLSLSGNVIGATATQIAASGSLFAFIKTKTDTVIYPILVSLNKDGTFNNPQAVFTDSLDIYYKFVGKKNSYMNNAVVNFFPDRLVSPGRVPINQNDIIRARIYDTTGLASAQSIYDKYWLTSHFNNDKHTLADVEVKGRTKTKEEILDDKYTSGLFKGGQARTFDIEDNVAAQGQMNILAYLQGRVAGLQINNPQSPNPSLSWRGSQPALFIDEMPQQDASMLTNLSMNDIAMVKVFEPPFMGAFGGGAGGGIAVYTKRGGDVTSNDNRPKTPHRQVIGYSAIKQFYVPNYLSFSENYDKQDLRQTLYWNPLIITTPQNPEVKLPFFNNDVTHAFRVILEGVNNNGQFIHLEKVYQ